MSRTWPQTVTAGLRGSLWGLLPAMLFLYCPLGPGFGLSGKMGSMLLLSTLVAGYDLESRRIPNALCGLTAACGLTWSLLQGGLPGLGASLLAGFIAFAIMSVFFFMNAMGGGDVKAIGSLATFLAPWGAVEFFVLTTLAGGALAVGRILLNPRAVKTIGGEGLENKSLTMPYGLAIWAATLVILIRSGGGS